MNKYHARQLIKSIMQELGLPPDETPPEWAIRLALRSYREGWEDGYDRASHTRILE